MVIWGINIDYIMMIIISSPYIIKHPLNGPNYVEITY